MRFCNKLAKLRKNNNLSQEQFADKMKVSRQAVSKWESGSSYPDMDKIIQMCKILNCNLDDLLDDGVIESKEQNQKINFNSYFNDFLNFITKVYNMFWSMKLKEKLKCLIEMFIIFCILFIVGAIIYSLIYSLILGNFFGIPVISFIVSHVVDPLLLIALIVLGIMIFLHLFKIRYLDYFITIEDNEATEKQTEKALPEEKKIDNKKYIVEKPKEKIIIRDPKHSTFHFFNALGKIILYIIKFFILLFMIPVLMFTIMLIAMDAISISMIGYGLLFLFIAIAILGGILLCYLVIYFVYNFIFNKKIKLKSTFITFIIGLVLIGVGSGLSMIKFMDYDYEESATSNLQTKEEIIDMNDKLIIQNYNGYYNVDYKIDNSADNIKLKITYPKFDEYYIYTNQSDNYNLYEVSFMTSNFFDIYKAIKNDLKEHKIRNYGTSYSLEITTSQENYEILTNNLKKYSEN